MFEHSPEQYKKIYIEGNRMPINRGMALGKEIAQALEDGRDTGELDKDLIIAQMPKLEIPELEIRADIIIAGLTVPVMSVIDSADRNLESILEYKTGVTTWDQKKADRHG